MLVADIADSTPLSRTMLPPEFAAMVAGWMECCHALVEANHGQINRWQGDSLFAIWVEAESAPAQVAGAMWALAEYFKESHIESRIVVHRGKIAFGGANSSGEENLFGSEVNFVFRLEKLAARLRESMVVSGAAAGPLQVHFPTKLCGSSVLGCGRWRNYGADPNIAEIELAENGPRMVGHFACRAVWSCDHCARGRVAQTRG